ncbi:hypothetical protein DYB32_010116 [Aphanomyces invadans]|uniref:Uncharacterized protein n=1 Tax=Aphanomyces invadans TaxID=157072 RepID=A0A3R6ZHJ4_9STRA|nr:hypothetical protein DYB32_010116 [Aphanomyces invadans]
MVSFQDCQCLLFSVEPRLDYTRNLYISQTNALTESGVKPFIMHVSTCIEPTKQRVAEWDMQKDSDDVTEGEWAFWFLQDYDVDPRVLVGCWTA